MTNNIEPTILILLADRCKLLRQKKNLTQEDVLNDTGIHIGRIETGKRDISITTLKKLCDYFEISISEFLLSIESNPVSEFD